MRVLAAALLTLLVSAAADAAPLRISCADKNRKPPYNTSGDPAKNNVPLNQCYKITPSGQCVYNLRRVFAAADRRRWNANCPPEVAGFDCCGWSAPVCCFAMDPLRPCPGFPSNGSMDLCRQYYCKWDVSAPGCSGERVRPPNTAR